MFAQGAQTYPNQMVRIVVPFSAGSMTDILARALADKLSTRWKQQVIVENRPGVAGTAGVAKSPGDGLTLMLTSNGHTIISAHQSQPDVRSGRRFLGRLDGGVDAVDPDRAAGCADEIAR